MNNGKAKQADVTPEVGKSYRTGYGDKWDVIAEDCKGVHWGLLYSKRLGYNGIMQSAVNITYPLEEWVEQEPHVIVTKTYKLYNGVHISIAGPISNVASWLDEYISAASCARNGLPYTQGADLEFIQQDLKKAKEQIINERKEGIDLFENAPEVIAGDETLLVRRLYNAN